MMITGYLVKRIIINKLLLMLCPLLGKLALLDFAVKLMGSVMETTLIHCLDLLYYRDGAG